MPTACLDPYGCYWSIGYLWRSMDWARRLDVAALAFMLTYVLAVVTHAFYRYNLVRARGIGCAAERKLAAELSLNARSLKSIAVAAPYLGLLGTCLGILNAPGIGSGIGMEKNAALALIASGTAASLITTAAGILVAFPATCSYNYLCTRICLLESKISNEANGALPSEQRFALAEPFSLPAFAVIATSGLAILVAVCTPFFAARHPGGFDIGLASERCGYDRAERVIVLHLSNTGRLSLNTEQEEWNSLASRLSEIYRMRVGRALYLLADDDVPFQTIADTLDIVVKTPVTRVLLITPKAMSARCPVPIEHRSSLPTR